VIAEYVAAKEAEDAPPPLYPVVELKTDNLTGWAVAFTDSDKNFLVMDADLISAATSLDMSPITTNTAVSYQGMQISTESPVVRFRTPSTNVSFLAVAGPISTIEEKMLLHNDGRTSPAKPSSDLGDGVVAVTDTQTNLVGIICRVAGDRSVVPLPECGKWKDITPKDFRSQTRLIMDAAKAVSGGSASRELLEQLGATDWSTIYFKQEANRIAKEARQGGTP